MANQEDKDIVARTAPSILKDVKQAVVTITKLLKTDLLIHPESRMFTIAQRTALGAAGMILVSFAEFIEMMQKEANQPEDPSLDHGFSVLSSKEQN